MWSDFDNFNIFQHFFFLMNMNLLFFVRNFYVWNLLNKIWLIWATLQYHLQCNQLSSFSGCSGPFVKNWPKEGPWIALIKRGDCTFSQKIKNAESLNASGVLVYDQDSGSGSLQRLQNSSFPNNTFLCDSF